MSSDRRRAPTLPRLHVVTDDSVLATADWETRAIVALEAGGPAVALHVRGPRTSGAVIYRLVSGLLPHARRTGGLLLVNDRVDVALALPVDGVHLGRRSLPLGTARELLGADARLGASVGSADGAACAAREGADYVFLGTIFGTPTHPGESGLGPEELGRVVGGAGGLAVIGIGGIDPARAKVVIGEGGHGVAVVRGVWEADDPADAVRRYLSAMMNGSDVS